MTDTFATGVSPRTATRSHHPQQLSQLLRNLSLNAGPKITLRDLAAAMEDRSFGAFLVVFALPNLIPLPPGATFILGLPLIFIAWQMFASRRTGIWLPKRMGDYAFDNTTFFVFVNRISPWLQRAETLIKPRAWFLGSRFAERLVGLLALILAVVIFLPIPFGNWLPAFALAVIGFAHTERDGLGLAAGALIGILSLAVAGTVIFAAGAVLAFLF
ncbi:exopolysaccharide biosynthesis protein exod [Pararhizobium polonicum]|uniref:Exopolysaccharide biosynthesis protein exod n=1 Tax=Pararhizobium polonicum TaxID=1612624 RepID=A0A1C7NXZ5_9HYPH|nr:exopolysaccharide biosynthesis protein [Pararhizobium polonicum]OBZ93877.1 exopolysaccharide biosynthesis protein exod [Pararhizobium polonicum]